MDSAINKMGDGEVKSQRLEFDNEPSFMRQLLITDQAKKSLIKPKIEAIESRLNSGLLDSVKKFLVDAKQKSESTNGDQSSGRPESDQQPMKNRSENGDLSDTSRSENEENPNSGDGLEIGGLDKQIGVEFDLLMYKEDSDSEESESESDEEN